MWRFGGDGLKESSSAGAGKTSAGILFRTRFHRIPTDLAERLQRCWFIPAYCNISAPKTHRNCSTARTERLWQRRARPPLHTESFSAAALRRDSRRSAEANPSLFIHYTCPMYYRCLPVRHQRRTRAPQNLHQTSQCRPGPGRVDLIENAPTRALSTHDALTDVSPPSWIHRCSKLLPAAEHETPCVKLWQREETSSVRAQAAGPREAAAAAAIIGPDACFIRPVQLLAPVLVNDQPE